MGEISAYNHKQLLYYTHSMNILQITIQTNNLLETAKFYTEVLELKIACKDQNSISFEAGQSTLTFIQSNKLSPQYHFAFNIPANKLEEAIAWASARLDLIENPENGIVANFESWNAKAIYFCDNNGNILEFIARFDLRNSSKKLFDSSCILLISEIGIVADFPINLADQLMEEYHLNFFEKGIKTEEFVTVGDDNGLFIIAATNRIWYPTAQQAKKYFAKVKISNNSLISELII